MSNILISHSRELSHKLSGRASLPWFFWAAPLLLLAAIAYFTPALDLSISSYFFNTETGDFTSGDIYQLVRAWGVIPAMLIAVSATLFLGLSYIYTNWRRWRPHALLLILPMVLGAGIITHTLLKDHWGRPRPRQVENFGGESHFRPFYKPNLSWQVQPYKSFPCGHCTMGFYFFAIALVGRRLGSSLLFGMGMTLAFILGIALSIARIAQGGHFFSDTLASALLMWIIAMSCNWLLFSHHERDL